MSGEIPFHPLQQLASPCLRNPPADEVMIDAGKDGFFFTTTTQTEDIKKSLQAILQIRKFFRQVILPDALNQLLQFFQLFSKIADDLPVLKR